MSTRTSPDLATRNVVTFATLLAPLALICMRYPGAFGRLLLALAAALAFESAALRLRRQALAPFLREGSWLVLAALVFACLASRPAWQLLCGTFVALVLARQAFGGLGRNLFHPVAAGVAFVVALDPGGATGPVPDRTLAFIWLCSGSMLLVARLVRWQAAAGLLVGVLGGILATGQPLEAMTEPQWVLAAFFIASDPVTTPENPRGRALLAGATGMAMATAGSGAWPFALLAMNALTPLVDSWLPAPRAKPVGA